MSPDGAWIYFESHRTSDDGSPSQIWRIASPVRSDGSTLVYRPPASVGASAQNPCYEPSSSQLLFTVFSNNYNNDNPPASNGTAGLYTIPAVGGTARTVVRHAGQAAVNLPGTCYNAITGRIAYSSDLTNTDNIWTSLPGSLNGSEHQVTCYTASTVHAQEPSWSPDGTHLVYELVNEGVANKVSIWTVPANDSCPNNFHPTRIVPATTGCNGSVVSPPDNHQPNWSPDGKRIVFQSSSTDASPTVNLWTVQPDGCGLTQVTKDSNSDTDASWSPDSTRIVYSTDFGSPTGVANLFTVQATAGGVRTRLTSQCFYDGAPSWSPDGRWVTFETWPVPNPGGNEIPTVLFRIPAAARPAAPTC
jgi:TolB protein